MKHQTAIALLALFMISLIPSAYAEEAGIDLNSPTSADADDSDASADATLGTRVKNRRDAREANIRESKDNDEDNEKSRDRNIAERVGKARTDRLGIGLDTKADLLDIRARQKAKLELAIERCEQQPDQAECERAIKNRQEMIAKLSEKDLEGAKRHDDRFRESAKELKTMLRQGAFAKFKHDSLLRARKLSETVKDSVEQNLADARKDFETAKDDYKESRKKFSEFKGVIKTSCKEETSETCASARTQARAHAALELEAALDVATTQLQKILARVNASEDLTAEEAAKITSALDLKLSAAAKLESDVKSLGGNATKQDIAMLAKKVRSLLKDFDSDARLHSGKVVNARLGNVLARSKRLQTRLDHFLVKLAENGKSTTEFEPLVAKFTTSLDASLASYKLAQTKFGARDVKGAHADMKAANEALKEAHATLKEITKLARSQGANTELESSLESSAVDAEVAAAAELTT